MLDFEIDTQTLIGVGVLAIMAEIIIFMILYYVTSSRIASTIGKIKVNLDVLMKFNLKQYEDQLTARVEERTKAEPAIAAPERDPRLPALNSEIGQPVQAAAPAPSGEPVRKRKNARPILTR